MAGARFLIDTMLGENENIHFTSDKRQIGSEILIDTSSDDSYWVSGNKQLALMGNLATSGSTRPSFVHFANWKRLNDARWDLCPERGRDFNFLPYSIGDSAVCYYYEPEIIPAGKDRVITIMLAAKDERGFLVRDTPSPVFNIPSTAWKEEMRQLMHADLYTLQELIIRLEEHNVSRILTDDELLRIRLLISEIKKKYNLPQNPW
jgi:hypothetical protein